MKKFYLETGINLQGSFKIKKLNLLLVFQVNCPGCFLYAFPVAVKLFERYNSSENVNIIGLSTSFEDFEDNTVKNTQLFLQKQQLIGETKKLFHLKGIEKYPILIPFSVAFDKLISNKSLSKKDIDLISEKMIESRDIQNKIEKNIVLDTIKNYISSQPILPYTFTINQLKGTPSWILFDSEYRILESWFGHKADSEIESVIEHYLKEHKI